MLVNVLIWATILTGFGEISNFGDSHNTNHSNYISSEIRCDDINHFLSAQKQISSCFIRRIETFTNTQFVKSNNIDFPDSKKTSKSFGNLIKKYALLILGLSIYSVIMLIFALYVVRLNFKYRHAIAQQEREINEKEKSQKALRDGELQHKTIMGSIQAGILLVNADTLLIQDVNDSAAEMIGLPKEKIIGSNCHNFINLTDEDSNLVLHDGKTSGNSESVLTCANGKETPVLRTLKHISIGEKKYLLDSFINISELKHTRDVLEESERRYRLLVENQGEGIGVSDLDENLLFSNPAAEEIFGVEPGALVGRNLKEFLSPEMIALVTNHTKSRLDEKKTTYEMVINRPDGELRNILITASPWVDNTGEVTGAFGIFRDITDAKQKQIALKESEEKFRILSSSAHEAIIMINDLAKVTFWNKAASVVFGFREEEILGKELHKVLVPKRFYDSFNTGFAKFIVSGQGTVIGHTVELFGLKKDGSEIPIELSLSSVMLKNHWNAIGILRDITERKRFEEQIATFKRLADSSGQGIGFGTFTGEVIYANPTLLQLMGIENPEDLPHCKFWNYFPRKNRLQLFRDIIPRVRQEGEWIGEFIVRKHNGELMTTIQNFFILNDGTGKPAYMANILTDITDQKNIEIELEKARNDAVSGARAKSEFLANMSHEIRTPLNAILGFTEILEEEIIDEKSKYHLEAISSSGQTLLRLINDILDLSKIEAGKLKLNYRAINLHAIFSEIEQIFSYKIQSKGLLFISEIDSSIPELLVLDETRIRQILLNLVGNAVKFTSEGHVKLCLNQRNTNYQNNKLDLVISVEDTGSGISKDDIEMIFNAFEQSGGGEQSGTQGSGLGLTISKRLVKMMKGNISVESVIGEGSIFKVELMNVRVGSIEERYVNKLVFDFEHLLFDKATILVVDDIAKNRVLISEYLKKFKTVRLIEAENGIIAIEKANEEKPDLILMDIKMPLMSGSEATVNLKKSNQTKAIPIIALTASVFKEDEKRFRKAGFDGYLRKPISKKDLITELVKFLPHAQKAKEEPLKIVINKSNESSVDVTEEQKASYKKILLEIRERIMPKYELLIDSLLIDEVEDFVDELLAICHDFESNIIQTWIDVLKKKIDLFDIDGMKISLNEFPLILEQIKSIIDVDAD